MKRLLQILFINMMLLYSMLSFADGAGSKDMMKQTTSMTPPDRPPSQMISSDNMNNGENSQMMSSDGMKKGENPEMMNSSDMNNGENSKMMNPSDMNNGENSKMMNSDSM